MFMKDLKAQFKWYLLISIAFWLFQSWLSREIPANLLGLVTVICFRLVIASLTAILFYSAVYCVDKFLKWSRGKLSHLSVILLLLFGVSIFMPSRADAISKYWKAAKPLIKKGATVIGIGYAVDKVVDKIDEFEDEAVSFTYYVADTLVDVYEWLTEDETYEYTVSCSQCSYVYRTNNYDDFMRKSGTGVCHDDYQPYTP